MSVSSVTLNLESRLEAYNLKVVDLIVALNLESKSRFCDIKITDIVLIELSIFQGQKFLMLYTIVLNFLLSLTNPLESYLA